MLPNPTLHAQLHSKKLLKKIFQEIALTGPIPFSRYMQMALYEPGLGYYCAGNIKFGAQGDFITAPEISSLFSRCIAKKCLQVCTQLSTGGILELGAGSGKMASDILLALEEKDCLPNFYWILEISPELKERQKQHLEATIPHLLGKVTWLSHLPKEFEGIILANEVVDAIPVHRFKKVHGSNVKEYFVNQVDNQLIWELDEPIHPELPEYVNSLNLPEGYTSEVNLLLSPWISSIAHCLKQGLLLIIDYGYLEKEYYHPQRNNGTLTCFYQHRSHDNPLILVGIQDISSHVNFTLLLDAAQKYGLQLTAYGTQAQFLIDSGILDLIQSISDPIELVKVNQQIKKLLLPSEMGELFKVIAFTKNFI